MTRTLSSLALLLALATLTGCPGALPELNDAADANEQAIAAQATVVDRAEKQLARLIAAGADEDVIAAANAVASDADAKLAALLIERDQIAERRNAELGRVDAETLAVGAGVNSLKKVPVVAPFADEVDVALGLLTVLFGGSSVVLARKRKAAEEAARSIARGVKAASQLNGTPGVLNFNDEKVREVLAAVMTPDGKRLVKEAGATVKATPTVTPKAA